MRSACPFAFVFLALFSAAQAIPQSHPNKDAANAASSGSAEGSRADLIRIAPNPQVDLGPHSNQKDQAGSLLNGFGSRVFTLDPAAERSEAEERALGELARAGRTWDSEDFSCLAIRSYRVVRDSPHSDSTHRVAYTTCVPAARFHYYTAVAHDR